MKKVGHASTTRLSTGDITYMYIKIQCYWIKTIFRTFTVLFNIVIFTHHLIKSPWSTGRVLISINSHSSEILRGNRSETLGGQETMGCTCNFMSIRVTKIFRKPPLMFWERLEGLDLVVPYIISSLLFSSFVRVKFNWRLSFLSYQSIWRSLL